ncbi:MAG: hypothetical protein JWP34_4528 [Massilia sp.]|nr:hypothetical protein [Massilia sp.]
MLAKRWIIGIAVCLALFGPFAVNKALANFSATTKTTGTWTAAANFILGTLNAWGWNGQGQLGLGDSTNRSSPVQVGTVATWVKVAAGGGFSCGVRSDGTLWCWGQNGSGQLGIGGGSGRQAAVQVGTAITWASVTAGDQHACATRTNGMLWCWGHNNDGQLGLGDTTGRNIPTQVGTATDWASPADGANHTCAIRTAGTLWCWGLNNSGQLGLGNTTNQNSPVQVGTATTWASVTAGDNHTCATRTNGTLWCWGLDSYGQLGLGADLSNRTIPVQVGAATDWLSATGGLAHTCGRRAGKSVWCWGRDNSGQLGLGDNNDRNVPTQITGFQAQRVTTGSQAQHTLAVV